MCHLHRPYIILLLFQNREFDVWDGSCSRNGLLRLFWFNGSITIIWCFFMVWCIFITKVLGVFISRVRHVFVWLSEWVFVCGFCWLWATPLSDTSSWFDASSSLRCWEYSSAGWDMFLFLKVSVCLRFWWFFLLRVSLVALIPLVDPKSYICWA